ncbi:hypothetical protein QQS21_006011 [Conoideocrella luteorostrata]|uniref:Zn(2)-C6 fungal-type domain-containing protein n=1 Tax=Conoideocrella luteorostrata TaxID=1105319 RepID=A0AAJ0FTB1_9HYPO|nr:hypothetical protein QQS21_006011 [Conoideocrella luteorostrata]
MACNEGKPVCDNCRRLGTDCVYDRVLPLQTPVISMAPFRPKSAEARVAAAISRNIDDSHLPDPPESKERRILETRLMYQYATSTGSTIAIDDKSRGMYVDLVPRVALTSDALLYCMYSLAALQCRVVGDLVGLVGRDTHRRYLSMGLREHNAAIATINTESADAICLTSALLRVCAFILLQDRVREPYRPPVEWLMMNASSKAIVRAASELPDGKGSSVAARMLGHSPLVSNVQKRFDPAQRRGLEHLLEHDEVRDAREAWDSDSREAYETTLSYLGGAIEAAREGDRHDGLRRLIIFPMLVQGRFIEMVQEREPRAIVFLAYYFALLALHKDRWWIGEAGALEVRAMAAHSTGHWRSLLQWPLTVVGTEQIPPTETVSI